MDSGNAGPVEEAWLGFRCRCKRFGGGGRSSTENAGEELGWLGQTVEREYESSSANTYNLTHAGDCSAY